MVHSLVPKTLMFLFILSLTYLTFAKAFVLSSHDFEAEHQLSDSLHGIVFLGTPHAGSDLSDFALALGYFIKLSLVKSPNTSNIAVLRRNSEVLAGIQDSFSKAITSRERSGKKPLAIHCFIEEYPVQVLGRVSVDRPSASITPSNLNLACRGACFGAFSGLSHVEYHSSQPHEHDEVSILVRSRI